MSAHIVPIVCINFYIWYVKKKFHGSGIMSSEGNYSGNHHQIRPICPRTRVLHYSVAPHESAHANPWHSLLLPQRRHKPLSQHSHPVHFTLSALSRNLSRMNSFEKALMGFVMEFIGSFSFFCPKGCALPGGPYSAHGYKS